MKTKFLLCFLLLAIYVPANSAIVDHTVLSDGDAFMDLESGLIWMDVDIYYGMTYNEVHASLTTGYSIATLDQMNAMMASAGSGYTHLADVMGDALHINGPNRIIYGMFDDQNANPNISTAYTYSHYASPNDHLRIASDNVSDSDTSLAFLGTFVVQADDQISPVPVPSSILLMGTGLLGLAGWGRKKFKNNSHAR